MDFNMNMFDFSTVADVDEYDPLPEGQYHCVVTDIERGRSKAGNPMWTWQMTVLDGPYKGKSLHDQVTFTEKGIKRVKFVLSRLADVDVSGKVDLNEALKAFRGKQAIVSVIIEEQPSIKDPTKMYRVNRVDFRGYERPEGFQYIQQGGNATQVQPTVLPTSDAPKPKKNGLAF